MNYYFVCGNMKQNLAFAFVHNSHGVPLAAGLLAPFTGWLFSPMIAALAMSGSSALVPINAPMLKWTKLAGIRQTGKKAGHAAQESSSGLIEEALMSTQAQEMTRTVAELTATGKGILAADESSGTIEKRFKAVNAPSTELTRRDYRELLFSTPGLGAFICGVILFEETLKQKGAADVPLSQLLAAQGIVPGIKVDKGTVPLPGFPGEKVTQGLDGLAQRLTEYKQLGARFAKWRAVMSIGAGLPTTPAIAANAHALARYAALCQEQGLVPIVEPEVLMDGDHTLATCARVTEEVLHAVFHELHRQRVALECMLLKPNMVVPGAACPEQVAPGQVAQATLACLRRTVPAAVPGIYFLSGGQDDMTATANLNAMNARPQKQPWVLSFSYGRALQAPALKAWRGDSANKTVAQHALYQRARLNGAAREGKYSAAMESETS